MFTGLVENIGTINSTGKNKDALKISIQAEGFFDDSNNGDSIAINGICLTIIEKTKNQALFEVSSESLSKTTLLSIKSNDKVNLEKSLTASKPIGGHFVLGHVDCVGKLINFEKVGSGFILKIEVPIEFTKYIVDKGSIALDGISLTINENQENWFNVFILKYTYQKTILKNKKISDLFNIEFDILGKYVENMLRKKINSKDNYETKITNSFLKENGFM
ncbi:MAG: riboflavin synthase [Pseudomonadota bacterium]